MFLFNYGLALYVSYPKYGDIHQPWAPAFNTLQGALLAMSELAFFGDPVKVFVTDVPTPATTSQAAADRTLQQLAAHSPSQLLPHLLS